jgi:hypothetical protein
MPTFPPWIHWSVALVIGGMAGFAVRTIRSPRFQTVGPAANDGSRPAAAPPRVVESLDDEKANRPDEAGLQPFPPGFEGLSYEEICRKGPASARFVALLAWVDRVPAEGIDDAARAIMRSLNDEWKPDGPIALSMLMARWGEKDPERALAALKASPYGRLPNLGWPALLSAMAGTDPGLAQQTFTENATLFLQPARAGLWSDFGIAIAGPQSHDSLEWAASLPASQRTSALVGLMHSGRFCSAESAESVRAYMFLPHVRSALLDRWSRDDPAAAAEWFKPLYQGREDVLLDRWAQDDPAAAVAWAGQNLEAEGQAKAWPSLAGTYAYRDPVAASEWIASLPEGPARMESIKQMASAWKDGAALEWARSLPFPEERVVAEQSYLDARKQEEATP